MYEDCFEKLRLFLIYLSTIKGRSKSTIYGYYTDLKMFFRFLLVYRGNYPAGTDLEDIKIETISDELLQSVTLTDMMEFMYYLQTDKDNSNKTRARKVSSLRTYFKYLHTQNIISANPAENLSTPNMKKTLPKYLSLDNCAALIDTIEDGPFMNRDYCIITLFLNCGMRLSELVGINVTDIQDKQLVLRGKGNKERVVYLNQSCIEAIEKYQAYKLVEFKNRTYDQRALFLNRNGKRLGKRRVEDIVDSYLNKADLKKAGMSTHKLRHTAATLMYQNDTDIRTLQEILGHNNLGTTQIYTHLSNKQVKTAIENNPVAKLKKK